MNAGLADVAGIALPVVGLMLAVLMLMVHRELGPFAGLRPAGKWMLTAAFGMGLAAFCFKLTAAAVMAGMPERTVDRLSRLRDFPSAEGASDNAVFDDPRGSGPYIWQALPDVAPAPPDNPTTPEKVALGRRLFFDRRLSADGTLNCASCHDLETRGGGDGRATAVGIGGRVGRRNAPTVWNAAFQSVLFWDGRAASLEAQATGPILNPDEMGMPSAAAVEQRLAADAAYRAQFERAFGAEGRDIRLGLVAKAIAAFERTLLTPDSPYDRFVRGDAKALTARQLRGMALFESLGCVSCHQGPGFSDASLLGGRAPLRMFPARPIPEESRYGLLGEHGTRGPWRVPSLRNVALSGPYFHNGAVSRLADAVRIMATAQLGATVAGANDPPPPTQWLADERRFRRDDRRIVGERDIDDLVAFLESLTSERLAAMRRQTL